MHDLEETIRSRCAGKTIIETGTCDGRTVEFVLKHGAKAVRSGEGSKVRYDNCVSKFTDDDRVQLWNGFSSDLLWEMIEDINEPVVFFLDAHPSGPGSYGHDEIQGGNPRFGQGNVLNQEIEIISRHHIKTHTVIVDDQHNHEDGLKVIEIFKKRFLEINPNYHFSIDKKSPNTPATTACCLVAEII